MTKNTAVTKTETQLPAFLRNTGPVRGAEEVGADDLVIPRLELVQSLSKCRKKSDPAYIEGIEEGELYNNVTRERYGSVVTLVPVYYKSTYLLWRDQDLGGGFAGSYSTIELAEKARQTQEAPDEWEAVRTGEHYCLILREDGRMQEILVSMAKSKLKHSKKWNALIRMTEQDSFARQYHYAGVDDKNAKNQDFFNVKISAAGFVAEEVYHRAEKLYELIQSGAVTVDRSTEEDIGGTARDDDQF